MSDYATDSCEACCERIGHTRQPCEELCEDAKRELAEDEEATMPDPKDYGREEALRTLDQAASNMAIHPHTAVDLRPVRAYIDRLTTPEDTTQAPSGSRIDACFCPILYAGFLAAGQGGDDPCGHTICSPRCMWNIGVEGCAHVR